MTIEINEVQLENLKHSIAEMLNDEIAARDAINSRRWDDPSGDIARLVKARTQRETALQLLRIIGIHGGFDESVSWDKPCDKSNVLFRYKGETF